MSASFAFFAQRDIAPATSTMESIAATRAIRLLCDDLASGAIASVRASGGNAIVGCIASASCVDRPAVVLLAAAAVPKTEDDAKTFSSSAIV